MINQVKSFLEKYELLNDKKTFLVGFSGGFDSMCLLDVLNKLKKDYSFNLVALHLNHNWRKKESDIEEENCRNFCQKNNIIFYSEKLQDNIQKTETIAREKRQEFFGKYYSKLNADALFLAHNKSDNIETVIYRMAKGTGVKGLCGIQEYNILLNKKIYRPLLNVTREEILEYCTKENLSPNNDSSNYDTKYARNFIRHKITPLLKKINPEIENSVLNLSKIALSEQNIINEYISLIKKEISENNCFSTIKFTSYSKDVQYKLIIDLLTELNIDFDSKKITEIYNFINANKYLKSGKTLSLKDSVWLFVSKDKIYKTKKAEKQLTEIEMSKSGIYNFNNFTIELKEYSNKKQKYYPKETDFEAIVSIPENCKIKIRTRRNGDFIQPFGMNGHMKLKKLFINKGIEKFKRDKIILLCNEKEVLWAVGVCLNEKLRVRTEPTHIISVKKLINED